MPYQLPPEVVVWGVEQSLNWWDEQKVKNLLPSFPGVFGNAVADWAKFKEGVAAGLFTAQQKRETLEWFRKFPDLWETLRPNYAKDERDKGYIESVDRFVNSLEADPVYKSTGLGLATAVIAGVLIVGGAAAALWAVQYIQQQANLSKMIDAVVVGKLPPDVLKKAIDAEQAGGLFGGISNVFQWIALGGLALFVLPKVWKTK